MPRWCSAIFGLIKRWILGDESSNKHPLSAQYDLISVYICAGQSTKCLYTNQLSLMQTAVAGYLTQNPTNNSLELTDSKNEELKLTELNQSLQKLKNKYVVDSAVPPVTSATAEDDKQVQQQNRRMLVKLQKCFQVNSVQEFFSNQAMILDEQASMIVMSAACCGCISSCQIPCCARTEKNCYCCRYVAAPQLCINENKSSSCIAIIRRTVCWMFCSTIWAGFQAVECCQLGISKCYPFSKAAHYCCQNLVQGCCKVCFCSSGSQTFCESSCQNCCCRSKEVKTMVGQLLDIYNKYEPKTSKQI